MKKRVNNIVVSFWQPDVMRSGHPREDFSAYDAETGIFTIADGVGLWRDIEYVGKYPKSSGSERLSRVFCQAFIRYLSRHSSGTMQEAFAAGNAATKRINKNRSKYDVFRKHRGLFAATAAMAHIKGGTLEWAHICDAGVIVIGKNGKVKLKKEGCDHYFPWPRDSHNYESSTGTLFARTLVRNAVSKDGKRLGYGVVTGEPEAILYLEQGRCRLAPEDVVILYTDGFAPYLTLPQFRKMLLKAKSKKEMVDGIQRFIEEKTVPFCKALRGKHIDGRASVEVIEDKLRKILGKRFSEVNWAKEKSLLVIRR